MQLMHRPLRASAQELGQRIEPALHGLVDQQLLGSCGTIEHCVENQIPGTRMSDTQTQAPEIRAQMLDHVAQAVVPAMAAAFFESRDTWGQINVVMHEQHLLRRNAIELRDRRRRAAASIHEGSRFGQP